MEFGHWKKESKHRRFRGVSFFCCLLNRQNTSSIQYQKQKAKKRELKIYEMTGFFQP